MGNFHKWIEINFTTDTPTDPKRTANKWWQGIPGTSYIDEQLIKRIAKGAANKDANAKVEAALWAGTTKIIRIFQQPIEGTLIKDVPQHLKRKQLDMAHVVIQSIHGCTFRFESQGNVGSIHFNLIPLPYTPVDEAALAVAILHETQHAQDHLLGADMSYGKDRLGREKENITMDEYLESEVETRAFTRQLLSLLNILQTEFNLSWDQCTKEIVKVMETSPVGSPYAIEVIKEFMRIVNRPATTEAVATQTGSKTEVVQRIVRLIANRLKKRGTAKDLLTKMGKAKGVDYYASN